MRRRTWQQGLEWSEVRESRKERSAEGLAGVARQLGQTQASIIVGPHWPFHIFQGPASCPKLSKEQIGHPCSESTGMPGNEYFWCLRGAWIIEQNPRKVHFPSAAHISSSQPTTVERGINELQTI